MGIDEYIFTTDRWVSVEIGVTNPANIYPAFLIVSITPFQGLGLYIYTQGFALGYHISGFQPVYSNKLVLLSDTALMLGI